MTGYDLLSKKFAEQKDIIISNIFGENNLTLANMDEIKRRCLMAQYKDGREVLVIDGRPIVEFLPAEIIQRNNKLFFEQKYRRL